MKKKKSCQEKLADSSDLPRVEEIEKALVDVNRIQVNPPNKSAVLC